MKEYFENIGNCGCAAKKQASQGDCMTNSSRAIPGTMPAEAAMPDRITGSMPSGVMPGAALEGGVCNDYLIEKNGLAQAYVPYQSNFIVQSEEKSLVCGTVFPELVKPYVKGAGLVPNSK